MRIQATVLAALGVLALPTAIRAQALDTSGENLWRYDRIGCVIGRCDQGIGFFQSLQGGLRMGYFVGGTLTEGVYLFDTGAMYVGQMNGIQRQGLGVEIRAAGAKTFQNSRGGSATGTAMFVDTTGESTCGSFEGNRWTPGGTMNLPQNRTTTSTVRFQKCATRHYRGVSTEFTASETSVHAGPWDWEFQRPVNGYAISYARNSNLKAGHHTTLSSGISRLTRGIEIDFRSAVSRMAGRCPVLIGDWATDGNAWVELNGVGLCYVRETGMVYYGEMRRGVPEGEGEAVWPDGRRESGRWRGGQRVP